MEVDGVDSELAHVSLESGSKENNLNGGLVLTEPIKFGSHGMDEPIRGEANNIAEANFPKDAVDEWPAPKQTHSFYFVKYRSYDDQKLKAKLDQADKELQRLNQTRFQITEKLRARRTDRARVIDQLKSLGEETKQFRLIMDGKRKEMEPLQQALGKLRGPNNAGREKGGFVCSSEQELNDLIRSLQYRIQHESIPLTEEKQILREIKQLEGTREKVIANDVMRAKIQDSMGEKEIIQDQVKLIGVDLDGVRKDQQVVKAKLKLHDDEKVAIDNDIKILQDELTIVTEKRDKAFEKIRELRKQREDGNSCFYQNRMLLIKARELAATNDIEALKELNDTEVEKFMSLWSSTKAFRDDYERRILPSLDIRQLSRDGRMRNPGEKPLVSPAEAPTPSETEILAKPKAKQPKEDSAPPPKQPKEDSATTQKEKNSEQQKEANSKIKGRKSSLEELEDTEEIFELEKVEKHPKKTNEVDEVKLKEIKREEEIAKAKQALERKKKLAEKTAAKAAIKSQKEAEKKLKDREKKAKKKLQASAPFPDPEEVTEAAVEVAEPEKADENVVAPVPSKSKGWKENTTIRHRGRTKGPESLSKVILKRKKPTNYWVWAAPVAVCVLALLVIGYTSLF